MNILKTVNCGNLKLTVNFPENASGEEIEDLEAVVKHFTCIGEIIDEAVELCPSCSKLLRNFGIFLFANTRQYLEIHWPNEAVGDVAAADWLYDLDEISPQTLLDIVTALHETSPESLDFHAQDIPFEATVDTSYLRNVLAFRY